MSNTTHPLDPLIEIFQPLMPFWEKSDEPWGFKDQNSKYVYANKAFFNLLNLKPGTKIKGLLDSELKQSTNKESPFAPFASQFQEQERETGETGETGKTVSSVETHCFGEEQLFQPYLFDNNPVFNDQEEYIGTMFHGKKLHFSTGMEYYFDNDKENKLPCLPEVPLTLLLKEPDNFFTDLEFDVVFLLLRQGRDGDQEERDRAMAEKLQSARSKENMKADDTLKKIQDTRKEVYEKIKKNRGKIYKEAKVEPLDDLKEFCREKKYDRYVPQRFFQARVGSIRIVSSE